MILQKDIALPRVEVSGSWENIFADEYRYALEAVLPAYLRARRWFGSKARTIRAAEIVDRIPLPFQSSRVYVTLIRVSYTEGESETYVLPLYYASGERAAGLSDEMPQAVVASLADARSDGILYDALLDAELPLMLLQLISLQDRFKGEQGEIVASRIRGLDALAGISITDLECRVHRGEQSNTSVIYGDRFILKLFRKVESGLNPDLEIGRHLTEQGLFKNIPPVAGWLEYRGRSGEPISLAILQGFVQNQGDAWAFTLEIVAQYFERALERQSETNALFFPRAALTDFTREEIPARVSELVGPYLEMARLLGRRTGELHLALAADTHDPAFAPEPFTPEHQRSLSEAMRVLAQQSLELSRHRIRTLPETVRADAERLRLQEERVLSRFRAVEEKPISAQRTRIHGDYHLGQVLFTGDDFVIIDFEGEPARPVGERRDKASPLRDVAGMIRSLHYASNYHLKVGNLDPGTIPILERWADFWFQWTSRAFLDGYLAAADRGAFLPASKDERAILLNVYLLSKALYELVYEMNNRPGWVSIPLRGILQLVQESAT